MTKHFLAFAVIAAAVLAFSCAAPVADLTPPATAGAGEPSLFAARDAVLLSWLEPVPHSDNVALRFARYASERWSQPRTIIARNDLFVNWADFPSVVEDRKGVLFAHWLQKSGGNGYAYDVRMAVSRDGGATWSTPFLLNRDGRKNEHGFVTLAPLPEGGVAATWLDGRNMPEGKEEGDMTLRYATIDESGAIRGEVQLDDRVCECCTTTMALVDGRPIVFYRDRSAGEIRDISFVRQTAGGWTKPAVLHNDGWKISGCPVNGPQAAADGRRVAVAWFSGANEQERVYVAFSNDGGATFGAPIVVDDGKPIGRVDLALTGEHAVVTWLEQTAAGGELHARRITPDGRRGASVKVADASTARSAGFARIAPVGDDLLVAWTDQSAAGKQIRVRRLNW